MTNHEYVIMNNQPTPGRSWALGHHFPEKTGKNIVFRTKMKLPEFSAGSSGSAGSARSTGSGAETVAQTLPSTRAGGQDDVSSQANSLK